MQAARAGDGPALTRLVPVLYRAAGALLRGRLGGAAPDDDLDDLASAGVVKAVERLAGARATSDGEFFAWFRALVWRAAIDHWRARRRRDPSCSGGVHAYDDGAGTGGLSVAVPTALICQLDGQCGRPDPCGDDGDDDTPTRVLARLAAEAQALLPPDAPFVLWAHLVDGAGWSEIALHVGTTPAGAKRRFQRALVTLRAEVWIRAVELPDGERAAVTRRLLVLDPTGPPARARATASVVPPASLT